MRPVGELCTGMTAARRVVVVGAVVLGVAGVFTAGQVAYARSDWGVAANAEVAPTVLWGKCLSVKPEWLGTAKPGIDPRSRLYYSPNVSPAPQRELLGWRFYGTWNSGGDTVGFECVTDSAGSSVQWFGPNVE